MSQSLKLLTLCGLIALVAACAPRAEEEEFVMVDPEPISVEPTHTGKFK